MSKKEYVIYGLVTVILAVVLLISPDYFVSSRRPVTQQRTEQPSEGYQGIISLWHIVEFKPYRGSLGSWVSDIAKQFEKEHRGVYIEVESITLEECSERIGRGERADVYSFPIGWAYPEDIMEIDIGDLPEFKGNLGECGKYDGKSFAYPYAASGYVLTVNQRLMQEQQISDGEALREGILNGEITSAGNAVAFAIYGGSGNLMNEEDFLNEKAMVLFDDGRAAGDMGRKVQQGKGFPYITYEFSNYSDLVQCMGVDDTTAAEKIPCICEFIRLVYAEESQAGLNKLGLVGAIEMNTSFRAETETEEQLFAELENIAAPNAFMFKSYRDQLKLSAGAAAAGDADAKKDFDLRMIELVRGADIK